MRDAGRDERPSGDAQDESSQAEDADDEALAVPGDGESREQYDQDQVEQVAGHVINL
jgi:hypothetical protein